MQHDDKNTTIALAAMVQAICLVQEIAQKGKTEQEAFETAIRSLFETNVSKPLDVYGNLDALRLGLEQLRCIVSEKTQTHRLLIQQVLSVIALEKKIRHSKKTKQFLKQRLTQLKNQASYFSVTHSTVIANLADCYLETIKPFHFRMSILGQARIINTHEAIEKIRALLLAAIRAANLWRQFGGSRLHLVFSRKKIKTITEQLLSEPYPVTLSHKEYT